MSVYAEYHHEYEDRYPLSDVFMGKIRGGYDLRKWLSLGGELQIMKMRDEITNTAAFGTALFFNWYFIHHKKWKLYWDNGMGMVFSAKEFPNGGTKFNFQIFYGLSGNIKVKPEA